MFIHHNQDVTKVICIVHNPVTGFPLNSMFSSQALAFANVRKMNHITDKSLCFNFLWLSGFVIETAQLWCKTLLQWTVRLTKQERWWKLETSDSRKSLDSYLLSFFFFLPLQRQVYPNQNLFVSLLNMCKSFWRMKLQICQNHSQLACVLLRFFNPNKVAAESFRCNFFFTGYFYKVFMMQLTDRMVGSLCWLS